MRGGISSPQEDIMDNDPHPIMDAIERLLANNPLEDSPVLLALLNWCRSQEISPDEIPLSIATLLGLFIRMRAEDGDDLNAGLKTSAEHINAAAQARIGYKAR